MNAILGRIPVEIAGEHRQFCADMNMAHVLYERLGRHWLLWVSERYLGKPTRVNGQRALHFEPIDPREVTMLVYALLATDRELAIQRGEVRAETEETLRQAISIIDMPNVEDYVRRALITCFGVPGKALEVVASAVDEPLGSVPAPTLGTGGKSLSWRLKQVFAWRPWGR